jgi:hypothetical protein
MSPETPSQPMAGYNGTSRRIVVQAGPGLLRDKSVSSTQLNRPTWKKMSLSPP